MSRGVLGRKQRTNTLSLKNENRRQDVQLRKNQARIFFINIYIYIYDGTFVNKSLAGTDIYGYGYYNTCTRRINMQV